MSKLEACRLASVTSRPSSETLERFEWKFCQCVGQDRRPAGTDPRLRRRHPRLEPAHQRDHGEGRRRSRPAAPRAKPPEIRADIRYAVRRDDALGRVPGRRLRPGQRRRGGRGYVAFGPSRRRHDLLHRLDSCRRGGVEERGRHRQTRDPGAGRQVAEPDFRRHRRGSGGNPRRRRLLNNTCSRATHRCMLVEASGSTRRRSRWRVVRQKATVGEPSAAGPHIRPARERGTVRQGEGPDRVRYRRGASLLLGGTGVRKGFNRGYFVRPTVFADATPRCASYARRSSDRC